MQPLLESEHGAWDSFVSNAQKGTIFQTAWWHQAWGVKPVIYARKDAGGGIEAGIAVNISRLPNLKAPLGIRAVVRPPLTPINGPVFLDCNKTSRSSRYTYFKKELLQTIESLPRLGLYDFGLWGYYEDIMPFLWNGFDTKVAYTYVIPKAEVNSWRGNMSQKSRYELRSASTEAEKMGFRVEADSPFPDVKALLVGTARDKGYSMSQYAGQLAPWWSEVKKHNAGKAYVIRDKDGKAVSATVMVWDSHTAYCLATGMDHDFRKKNSILNMLLFERMICDALEMGLDFDFEGSILRGVETFFRQWGGELRPNYRVIKIPSVIAFAGIKAYWYFKFHRRRCWVSPE